MACNIEKQIDIIKALIRMKPRTSEDVLKILNTKLDSTHASIDTVVKEFSGKSLDSFSKILTAIGAPIDTNQASSVKVEVVSKPVNNIVSLFNSPNISDLFDTLHVAEGFFESHSNRLIMEAVKMGYENSITFVKNDTEVNNNIKTLKNTLFENVIRYLDSHGQIANRDTYFKNENFIAKLYDNGGNLKNYNLFKEGIDLFEAYLLKNENETFKSYSEKVIPDLIGNIRNTAFRNKLEAYNSAIMLVNFDNVIAKYFKNILQVNYSVYNNFSDPIVGNKYTAISKGFETTYWAADEHSSEAAEVLEDDLTKRIINMIPHVDKAGNESGSYLETKDLYSLASFIHTIEQNNFNELSKDITWKPFNEDSKYMLDWYINHINEAVKNNFMPNTEYEKYNIFRHKIDIVNSLQNFSNKVLTKETNSTGSVLNILTQVINNSYGANYSIYNANTHKHESKEMHSHNADKIALQNSIYAHLSQLTTQPENFIFKEIGQSSTEELVNIKELTNTNKKLSKFIKDTLGISLGVHGAMDLRELWDKNGTTLEGNIQNYLDGIRTPIKEGELNTLGKIIQNEINITDQTADQAESQSIIINPVSTKVQDILDIYLDNFILKPITTISTLSGEKIPTYKTATLTYNDVSLLRSRNKIELDKKDSIAYKNLFLSDGGLMGTSTKLEVINKDFNKSAFKFGVLENFTANFEYDFLDAFINPNAKHINVIIGNYSDKNTIPAKMIDSTIKHNGQSIIGDVSGKNVMSIDQVSDLVRTQSNKYYSDLFNELFSQYSKLGVKISNATSPAAFDTNTVAVNTFLGKFASKDSLLDFVKTKWNTDKSINLQIEHHYSNYGNRIALNQSLVDNYRIFDNGENFKTFLDIQEQSLINKLKEEKGELLFDSIDVDKILTSTRKTKNDEINEGIFDSLLKSFGIEKKSYSTFVNKDNEHKISNKVGNINPLLKRWLLVNSLFRNEYLYISVKGEYMHPHKSNTQYRGDSNKINWVALAIESNGRLSSMAKRNVTFTATIELPTRKTNLGIPDNVNLAVINDHKDMLYTLSGKTHNQEVHDGSSVINYAYSKMVEASYPGKSYSGTKKQFGTFVSEYGVTIKKDAETELTNDKIRNSNNSTIQFKNLQKQVYGINFNIDNISKDNIESYFYRNGYYYKINKYSISNNQLTTELSKYNKNTSKFEFLGKQEPVSINNLYDVWEIFGGEYSIDNDLKHFNEKSNDIVYDLVTSYKKEGSYPLKDKMIHIVSNASAIKAGASNINPSKNWSDGQMLSFSTFEHRHMGPQLDANHHADASKIKEITQVISALSQNEKTAYLANEIYEDLARIINEAAKPYIESITGVTDQKMKDLYLILSKNLAKSLSTSTNVNLAQTIAETFEKGKILPFSNQHFFQEFIRTMISKMNSEFITRYYSGIAAVLNPSHGIIQLYEDANGVVYNQEDITKEAFDKYIPIESIVVPTQDIIKNYIAVKFSPTQNFNVSELQPGDTVIIDGIKTMLGTPRQYLDFKRNYKSSTVIKDNSTPRDLRPSLISFNVVTDEGIIPRNIFDTDSVRLRFFLNNIKDGNFDKTDPDYTILTNFVAETKISMELLEQSNDRNNEMAGEAFDQVDKLLNDWTQRNLQLLDGSRIMKDVNINTNFKDYFGTDTLTGTFDDVKPYWDLNSLAVINYLFKPAEIVLPNIYKTDFGTGDDTINEIRSQGPKYFRDKLAKEFEVDDIKYDLKLNIKNGEKPIYVKYVTELPQIIENDNAFDISYNYTSQGVIISKIRLSSTGEKLYEKPQNSIINVTNDYDIIYLKLGVPTEKNQILLDPMFKNSVKGLIKSFRNEISSIVPLMNNDIPNVVTVDNLTVNSFNTNETSYNVFSKFSGYRAIPGKLNSNWFIDNKETILNQLSDKMFASWEKSHQSVVARIPSQSMQSFMEMKNIAYFNTKSNDAYVSVWQIYIQGSDFR